MTDLEAMAILQERQNEYARNYRKAHPEKTREKNRRYREKLAQRLVCGEKLNGAVFGERENNVSSDENS